LEFEDVDGIDSIGSINEDEDEAVIDVLLLLFFRSTYSNHLLYKI
jgi:hypothetical protein